MHPPASSGSERELSSDLAAALIEEQFPHLAPVRATFFDEGWSTQAFEIAGGWIFRFPKRERADRALGVERAVLPVLAPRVGMRVPSLELVGRPSERFPLGFVGYRKIEGVSALHVDPRRVVVAEVGAALGQFLDRLHAFPVETARALGVSEVEADRAPQRLRLRALPLLNVARRAAPDAVVRGCADLLSDPDDVPTPSPLGPRLVHVQLTEEHILLGPDYAQVTGVVDWGSMAIADPTLDFAGLYHWLGAPLVRAALAAYGGPTDAGLVDRARYIAACQGLITLAFGIDTDRTEFITAGVRAMTHAAQARRP